MREIVWDIDKLREIALDQHGFVTTSQAKESGVSKATLSKLAARERIERVAHGVYRVPQVPSSHYDRFMLAVLWTGTTEALISHESALDIYGVCDVNPRAIDITVPEGKRISRRGGEGYRIHHENIKEGDRTWREEVPVVTLVRAIEQCVLAGTSTYLLEQAAERGLAEGLIATGDHGRLTEMLRGRYGG